MPYSNDDLNYIYDKNDGYCVYCGKKLSFHNYGKIGERGAWEIDHSVPKARGGTNYLRNLVPACVDCNRQKGTRMGKSVRAASTSQTPTQSVGLGELLFGIGAAYLLYRIIAPKN